MLRFAQTPFAARNLGGHIVQHIAVITACLQYRTVFRNHVKQLTRCFEVMLAIQCCIFCQISNF